MIYNLNLEEFETIANQLLLQEEMTELDILLLNNDIDEFVVCPSSQEAATFTLENDKIFIKVRGGLFKNLR